MGRDFYCAICGGLFFGAGLMPPEGDQYPEDFDFEEAMDRYNGCWRETSDDYCDNTVLGEQSVAWLGDLRVIGKTKHKAFITGTGMPWSDRNEVSVSPGDDENVPNFHQLRPAFQPGKLRLQVYFDQWSSLWHSAYPFHTKCFDLLQRVYTDRLASTGCEATEPDLNVLHETMRKQGVKYNAHLNLNSYAEFSDYLGQWWAGPGESLEPWYHDPVDVPVLNALNKRHERRRVRIWARGSKSATNCLSDLPIELLMQIANQLDMKFVIRLTMTCREVNAIVSKNFWRRRLFDDMPYLFELRQATSKDPSLSDVIDWQDLYGRMLLQSNPGRWDRIWWKFTDTTRKLPQDADRILNRFGGYGCGGLLKRGNMANKFDPTLIGIASRRRVWRCAEELLDLCEQHAMADKDKDYETEPEDEENGDEEDED